MVLPVARTPVGEEEAPFQVRGDGTVSKFQLVRDRLRMYKVRYF
jgi:hypothetical protein